MYLDCHHRISNYLRHLADILDKDDSVNDDLAYKLFADFLDETFTRTEAAKYLGISERQFDRYRKEGLIPQGKKRAGRLRVWTKFQLDEFKRREK